MESGDKENSVVDELRGRHVEAGIDVSLWGSGVAKSLLDLQREIDKGEAHLIIDKKTGRVLREVVGFSF
jgi:hypothetical protein